MNSSISWCCWEVILSAGSPDIATEICDQEAKNILLNLYYALLARYTEH